jgi:hypothetical protein
VLTVLGLPRSQATDPVAVLQAYVTFYDQRGGGIETSLKGDKQGWGLTKRNKKRGDRATPVGAAGLVGPQCGGLGTLLVGRSPSVALGNLAHGA